MSEDNQVWKQVSLVVDGAKAEEVSDILFYLGSVAVTYEDAKDDPILEPLPSEQKMWPTTIVTGLFTQGFDTAPVISYLQHLYGDQYPIAEHDLEDKDWVRAWMDNFKPIKCGSKLWICPSWCEVPDPQAVNVMLDPGLAFGTGTHPTTFLCLGFLDSLPDLHQSNVLDYGCGSGILAIAALKLGAPEAYGVDIDPQALIASRDNAERNQVADRLKLVDGSNASSLPACPVVVANILAGPLAQLEPHIAALCQSGGKLALSGILETQADEVIAAYQQDFVIDGTKTKEGWVLITATRK